ncbi:MAG TPA: DUF6429 family protein [Anaerolineae bacterium]|jgi:hypothetical protein
MTEQAGDQLQQDAERQELIEELTLVLLYLSSWEEKNAGNTLRKAWKGYTFSTLNALEERGLIHQSHRAKSLTLTEEGVALALELEHRFKP